MTGIILAHGGAQEIIECNRSTWTSWFDHLEWIVPEDDPLPWDCHKVGISCHEGQDTVDRQRYACKLASEFESAAIVEYDTLLFGKAPVPVDGEMHCSWIFYEYGDHPFRSTLFGHSPWVCSKKDFARFAEADVGLELGFSDRWMAAAAVDLGVSMHGLPEGWSELCIRNHEMDMALSYARRGATALHGVKSKFVFDHLTEAHPNYPTH